MLQPSQENLKAVRTAMKMKDYPVFTNDSRNYNLNIVGIRSTNTQADTFDDTMMVFWKYQGKWEIRSYNITTDPGLHSLEKFNSKKVSGCAILKEGRYPRVYMIDTHNSKSPNGHKALCQRNGAVTVYRDRNRDNILDFTGCPEETSSKLGINIHRSSLKSDSAHKSVGGWSAGCQVFSSSKDFNEFLGMCEKAAGIYGNQFTYTLLNIRDIEMAKESLRIPKVA